MKQKTLVKPLIFCVVTVVIGGWFWLMVRQALAVKFSFDKYVLVSWSPLLFAFIAFIIYLSFLAILGAIVRQYYLVLPTLLMVSLLQVFFFRGTPWYLLVVPIFFLAALLYVFEVRSEFANRIKISISKSVYFGLTLVVTACLVVVSFSYYTTLTATDETGEKLVNSITNASTNYVSHFFESRVQNYHPEMTVDQFFGQINIAQLLDQMTVNLPSGLLPPDFRQNILQSEETQKAIEAQEQTMKQETISQIRDDFLKQFKIEAKGSDTIYSVFEKIVGDRVSQALMPLKRWIPPLLAVSLFFLLEALTFLYIWLIRLTTFLLFKILLLTRSIKVQKEMKEVEVVSW